MNKIRYGLAAVVAGVALVALPAVASAQAVVQGAHDQAVVQGAHDQAVVQGAHDQAVTAPPSGGRDLFVATADSIAAFTAVGLAGVWVLRRRNRTTA